MKKSLALTLLFSLTLTACDDTTLHLTDSDNPVDTTLGSDTDSATETIPEDETETGSEIDITPGSEVEAGSETEIIPESETETGSEIDIVPGNEVEAGSGAETTTEGETETGSEIDITPGSEIETGSGTEITPEGETDSVTTSLDQWVDTYELSLSGVAKNGSTITNTIFPAARPDGGLTLGWNEMDQGHLMRIDSDMKAEGVEWDLDGLMIVGTLGLPDDGVAVLVIDWTSSMTDSFNVDRHLRLFIYDAKGNKTRETSIVGGTGIGVPSSWFSWSSSRSVDMKLKGDRIAIFTKISRHWTEESGTHQGDLYIEVDADGKLDESTYDVWSASHSNRQHLVLGPNDEGLRLIVGDANPFGLEYQTKEQYGDVVVWPNEEQQEIGKELSKSSVSAGDLCGFQYRNGRLFATVASGRTQPFDPSNDYGDVLLLSWALGINEGDEISETWLTETPEIAEKCPTLTAIGEDNQLIVWGSREGTAAILALLDGQGELISGPTASTHSFHSNSLAIAMPNGSVVWTYAERNATKVKISIVKEQ